MKLTKLISLLLALLMMTSILVACASTPEDQPDEPGDTTDQPTTPDGGKVPGDEEKPFGHICVYEAEASDGENIVKMPFSKYKIDEEDLPR